MKAWMYSRFSGGAGALHLEQDIPVPIASRGSLLVRVKAASVNPIDWKLQEGLLRPLLPPRLPYIPGFDIAGDVTAVGAGVTAFKPGDSVFGVADPMVNGGLAEYALVREGSAALRPPQVSEEDAASLPVAGVTALQALRDFCGLPLPGKRGLLGAASGSGGPPAGYQGHVLVANASGGVGHFAVQLAKLAGARVTALVGPGNIEFARRSLRADHPLSYKSPEGQQLRSPSGLPYDAIVDGTKGLEWSHVKQQLGPKGVWVHLTPGPAFFRRAFWQAVTLQSKKALPFWAIQNTKDLGILAEFVKDGKLKVVKNAVVPFEKAPAAWEKSIEGHVVGKVVIKM